jgi:hypothetical protein
MKREYAIVMTKKDAIKLFEDKKIRSLWDDETEKWYFSIIDTIEALVGTDRPRKYWNDLKIKLEKEGSEVSEKIGQLKINPDNCPYYKYRRWHYRKNVRKI